MVEEGTEQVFSSVLKKYSVDALAAGGAALLVSPFITIVDRSIIENASGIRPLKIGLKELLNQFLRHPIQFMRRKEFLLIYGLYSSTYLTANSIDTTCELVERDNQLPKFIGTTAVNMTLCIAKDREFTRMFGAIAPSSVPLATYALFAFRDSLTVAASFNFPKVMTHQLETRSNMQREHAEKVSQLFCPAAVQFISTPMHLLGLDLYNHRTKSSKARISFISTEYFKSTLARIGRIGPAFGIGGIGNKYFRDSLREEFI